MLKQNCEFVVFMGHFDYFDHFGLCTALLWPNNGLRSLKSQYETGQDRPIGGQKATKMRFGTVLDHVDGILVQGSTIWLQGSTIWLQGSTVWLQGSTIWLQGSIGCKLFGCKAPPFGCSETVEPY